MLCAQPLAMSISAARMVFAALAQMQHTPAANISAPVYAEFTFQILAAAARERPCASGSTLSLSQYGVRP